MPRQLTITPAPYKSSFLAIPPTPFSPLLPITPPASPPRAHSNNPHPANSRAAKLKASAELLPPPADSLHWLWQCHKCNRVYQLGVTRRCLDDGHFFCAGTTTVKRSRKGNGTKKIVRHAACASEFDYQGWKTWGNWRRSVVERVEAAEALMIAEEAFEKTMTRDAIHGRTGLEEGMWFQGRWTTRPEERFLKPNAGYAGKKDCWMRCDYPSECRWGKQFGIQQSSSSPATTVASPTTNSSATPTSTKTTNNNVLVVVPSSPATTTSEPPPQKDHHQKEKGTSSVKPKTSFEEILASLAKGPFSISPPSKDTNKTNEDSLFSPPEPEQNPVQKQKQKQQEPEPEPEQDPDYMYLSPLSPTPSHRQKAHSEGETKVPTPDDLLEMVKRRKRRSSVHFPSPLGANPPGPTTARQKGKKGVVEVGSGDEGVGVRVGSGRELGQRADTTAIMDDVELELEMEMGLKLERQRSGLSWEVWQGGFL